MFCYFLSLCDGLSCVLPVSMPTSSLDKDVTKEVACTEVTPKDVPDGEWQLVRKRKGKKQIVSIQINRSS